MVLYAAQPENAIQLTTPKTLHVQVLKQRLGLGHADAAVEQSMQKRRVGSKYTQASAL